MRRLALLTAFLGALLGGCGALEPPGPPSGEEAPAMLGLELQCGPPGTRAGEPGPEYAIHGGCVLEFNSAGERLEYLAFTGEEPPQIPVPRNQQVEIYVVANPTCDLSEVSSKAELEQMRSDYTANTAGNLEMIGRYSGRISSDSTVNVSLERICAKIQVSKMVFKVASTRYEFTDADLNMAYMEKTPKDCSYLQKVPGELMDTNTDRVDIGYIKRLLKNETRYEQGEYKVWEYDDPWCVYCYPNASTDRQKRNVFYVAYRFRYKTSWIDAATGRQEIVFLYENAFARFYMPPMMPNTLYELEKVVIDGTLNKSVDLDTKGGSGEAVECVFRMTDMTSGEYLGELKGEVRYE